MVHVQHKVSMQQLPSQDSDSTNLLQGLTDLVPVITLILLGIGGYTSLQGQVIELRAKYEASTSSTREALQDIRNDVKENSTLLREILTGRDNDKTQPHRK